MQQINFFNMLNTSFVSENKRSNFFKEAVSTLDISENYFINISDPIEKAVSKYKFHPSILFINDKISSQDKFSFKPISNLGIEKEVQLINPKKATTSDSIPPRILKISSEASADVLHNLFKNWKFS